MGNPSAHGVAVIWNNARLSPIPALLPLHESDTMSLTDSVGRNRFRPTLTVLEGRENPASGYLASGAIAGGLPLVQVTNPDGSILAQFMAFDSAFRGGVRVATGNLDGNTNVVDVVAVPGPGGGPLIRVFAVDITTGQVTQETTFFAFDSGFRNGLRVAVGQIDGVGQETTSATDLGSPEQIIVGADAGGGPRVSIFQLQGGTGVQIPGPLGNFFAFDSNFRGGVRLAAGEVIANTLNEDDVIVGAGPGGGSEVRVFAPDGSIVRDFSDLAVDPSDGVNVAFAPATGQIVTDGLSSDFSQRNVSLNAASLAGTQSTVVTTTTASLPGSTAPLQGSDTVPLQGSDTAPLQGSDTTPLQPTSGSVPLS